MSLLTGRGRHTVCAPPQSVRCRHGRTRHGDEREPRLARRAGTETRRRSRRWSIRSAPSSTPTATGCSASVHDAEDALQETLLRAWRALARFEGRSSLRSWLYTIATNTSLNLIARRPKRVLPVDFGPADRPRGRTRRAGRRVDLDRAVPRRAAGGGRARASPEARYELRESVELAFVAALQHLPPPSGRCSSSARCSGSRPRRSADALDTTVASVNSALQRARKAVAERTPEQTQQQTLRALGDERLEAIVEPLRRAAWERDDVEAVVAMLTEDAAIAMPPLRSWFGGNRAEFARFPASCGRCRATGTGRRVRTSANGQPAIGFYAYNDELGATSRSRSTCSAPRRAGRGRRGVRRAGDRPPAGRSYERWPDRPPNPDWMQRRLRPVRAARPALTADGQAGPASVEQLERRQGEELDQRLRQRHPLEDPPGLLAAAPPARSPRRPSRGSSPSPRRGSGARARR